MTYPKFRLLTDPAPEVELEFVPISEFSACGLLRHAQMEEYLHGDWSEGSIPANAAPTITINVVNKGYESPFEDANRHVLAVQQAMSETPLPEERRVQVLFDLICEQAEHISQDRQCSIYVNAVVILRGNLPVIGTFYAGDCYSNSTVCIYHKGRRTDR